MLVERLQEADQRFNPIPRHILQQHAASLDHFECLRVEDRKGAVVIFVNGVSFQHVDKLARKG